MKMKRILAFALAVCMLGSSLLMGSSNDVAYAYEAEQVINELRKVDAQDKGTVSTQQNDTENNLVLDVENIETEDETDETPDNIISKDEVEAFETEDGVVAGEEFAEPSTAPESAETESEVEIGTGSDVIEGESTRIDVNIEEVETNVDLTAGAVETTLLTEETVNDEDMVDVIVIFDANSVIDGNPSATMNFFTKVQIGFMEFAQNIIISRIEKNALNGTKLDIDYQYTWLLNGIATEVPYGLIDEIEAVKGVKEVLLQPYYEVCDFDTSSNGTIADDEMIGRDDTWASGYTGKGVKIAIIDTGIDEDHQNFQAMDSDKLTDDSATKETIGAVLSNLNASALVEDLTADDVYLSNKVAYAFNYADGSLSINHKGDSQGDHGTHVAGIAAANDLDNGEAVGTAPDAQIYVMKVFGASHSGAAAADLLAAVEDAMILGAEVINMSVGSAAGFTSDGEAYDEIYGKVAEAGVVLAVSAGNSNTSGYDNLWGTDQNLTSNPDNATISSPGTYVNVTTVASVENVAYKSLYVEVEGKKFAYYEATGGENKSVMTIAGEEYEYVYIPNCGQSEEDFAGIDCEGKIALIQRGVTAFTEKCRLAEEAGAIACVIFNNETGAIGLNMTGGTATIPCVSITMQAGEQMVAALEENAEATMLFSKEEGLVDSDVAYQMSDFSSWGVSPDLKLEPDITAPGGMIYSTLDDGEYGLMSGTSMSSPNVAGLAALMTQYVDENYSELSDAESRTMINALLMSTAKILETDGLAYSPRLQGAGLANAYLAINSGAYLSVDGMDLPKVELLDDPERTGNYSYAFNVVNFGDSTIYYHLDTTTQTEGVDLYELAEDEYLGFMSSTPEVLGAVTSESSDNMVLTYDYNADSKANILDAVGLYVNVAGNKEISGVEFFRYNLDGDEDVDKADVQAYLDALVKKDADTKLDDKVLKVEAGKTAKVNVNVAVTEAGKAYMDTYFENGIYVEGYTILTAESVGDIDLSLPYMGFYGDWTEAPSIDNGYYWETEEETMASQYVNMLFTQYDGDDYSWYPGLNPYFPFYEEFDINNVALSPNGDGYADYISDMYIALLRNAAELSFTYTTEDGEVVFEEVVNNVRKSVYMDAYAMVVPYVYQWYSEPYDLTDEDGNPLEDGTKLTLSVKAVLDYDEHDSNNEFDEWEIPITIDTSAPEILDAYIEEIADETTGTVKYYLNMKFADNHATAAVNFLTKSGTVILAQYAVDHTVEEGAEYVTYDVTGYGDEFMVVLGDYAFNEGAYYIEAEGNDPVLDDSLLYGYRVYDSEIYDDTLYGWLSIDPEDASVQVLDSEYYMDYALVAAEYVGGYIIAVDSNKDLVAIKPGYWDERTRIANIGSEVRDMAFDPTTDTLYALYRNDYCLVSIDIKTGEITFIGDEYSISSAITLTCDDNGQLYAINTSGELKKIDKTTGEYEDGVVLNLKAITGKYPSYTQSMTYDSEADCIYWASYSYSWYTGSTGALYKIDLSGDTPSMEAIGTVAGNAEVVGLLSLDNKGYELPTDEAVEAIDIEQEQVALLVNNSETLRLVLDPWYGVKGETTWTSNDENVAVVSDRGVVTATGVGETTVTVSIVIDEDTTLTATTDIKVVNPDASVNGFVMAGMESLYNQWVTFDATDMSYEAHTDISFDVYTAGEYVDGTIYAYGQDTSFNKIDAETYEATLINGPRSDYQVIDMSYDYSTGYMYGIVQDMNYGTTYLAHIDMITGEFIVLGEMWDDYYETMCALAVSTDGIIYVMSGTGFLYTVEVVSGEDDLGEYQYCELTSLGYVGCSTLSVYTQSMTYDHNAENPGLYWSAIPDSFSITYVDLETVTALDLGTFDGGVQMTCMYIIPDEENVPELEEVAVTDMTLTADSVTVLAGSTAVAPVQVLPLNATDRNVVWTVTDETVATISNGIVTGVGKGTTTATGVLAGKEVTLTINVLDAAGDLRGHLLADMYTGDMGFWISVDDRDLSSGVAITNYTDYTLYAGEYYNGKIYGYGVDYDTYDSVFVVVDEVEGATEGEELYVTESMTVGEYPDVVDMAFDYTEGVMYAVAGTRNVYGPNALYCVDITTGQLYKVGDMTDQLMTLACTAEGQLYGVGMEGAFYAIDKYTAELDLIAQTEYMANQYQSMAYDHNSGNIYWAQVMSAGWSASANLFIVDPTDGSLFDLGHIGMMGAEVSALHTIPNEELEVGAASVARLALNSTNEVLKPQDTVALSAVALPVSVNATVVEFTFASDNTAVATVDANGVVTAVAAGTANITVSANGITATCKINVVDDTTKVQVMTNDGWQVSPLLNPSVIDDTVTLPAESGLDMAMVTYADGWYYALDTANAFEGSAANYQTVAYSRGYLWKFNEDFSVVEKVSDTAIYTTFPNCDDDYLVAEAVLDIFTNPFTGDVYVLGRANEDGWWNEYYIYKLDVTTGATTYVGAISYDIASPQKIEFIAENTMVVWDHYNDYVYTTSTTERDDYGNLKATQLVWAQGTVAAGYNLAMAYNKELDVVFVATADEWLNEGKMALYILNPNKKTIEKYEDAAYDTDMIDIVFAGQND